MPEECLDEAKIPAAVEKMGGNTVAQHVGMNSAKSCAQPGLTNNPADRPDVQRATTFPDDAARRRREEIAHASIPQVRLHGFCGIPAERHDALFVPLAQDLDRAPREIYVLDPDIHDFG